jgi:hypothetical protein
MHSTISAVIKPLLERKIFATEEEAVRELVKDYILRQITHYQRENIRLTRKYGLTFERFGEYLRERSSLLEKGLLADDQRRDLGQAVMQEEEDFFDWKVSREMLDSWLGLGQEIDA